MALYFYDHMPFDGFIQHNTVLLASILASFTITVWFWARYIYRNSRFHKVFDHDVGAALARLRWR